MVSGFDCWLLLMLVVAVVFCSGIGVLYSEFWLFLCLCYGVCLGVGGLLGLKTCGRGCFCG